MAKAAATKNKVAMDALVILFFISISSVDFYGLDFYDPLSPFRQSSVDPNFVERRVPLYRSACQCHLHVPPNPVTNEEFTKTLGEVLYRPTFLPLPEFAVSMILGEMGDALLLASTKVLPKRLQDAGFEFKYPYLKEAIEEAVK